MKSCFVTCAVACAFLLGAVCNERTARTAAVERAVQQWFSASNRVDVQLRERRVDHGVGRQRLAVTWFENGTKQTRNAWYSERSGMVYYVEPIEFVRDGAGS